MNVLPAVFSLVLSLLVLASIWSWIHALQRLRKRQPLLAFEPRRTPPWNLIDICMVVVLWAVLQLVAAGLLNAVEPVQGNVAATPAIEAADVAPVGTSMDSATLRWAILLSGVASLLVCALGGLLIVIRTGARWGTDLGLTLRHAGRDISVGIIAFAMLAPIIYSINLILVQIHPSEHPLIESFRTNPTWGFYLVCVFSAAIAAPLSEEFICRVLLQGLFERILAADSYEEALFFTSAPEVVHAGLAPAPVVPSHAPPNELDAHPYHSEGLLGAVVGDDTQVDEPAIWPFGWWRGQIPILLSSLVFAGLHLGNGLDPIPLFVLALGLGYLYQRTHRILPCVVVHFLVNALALAMLGMSLVVK